MLVHAVNTVSMDTTWNISAYIQNCCMLGTVVLFVYTLQQKSFLLLLKCKHLVTEDKDSWLGIRIGFLTISKMALTYLYHFVLHAPSTDNLKIKILTNSEKLEDVYILQYQNPTKTLILCVKTSIWNHSLIKIYGFVLINGKIICIQKDCLKTKR